MTTTKPSTGADLVRALESIEPPDDDFERSITDALAFLDQAEQPDPWADSGSAGRLCLA